MPSVASEVAVQQSKRPEPGRPSPPARAPSTPFDQVLDAATNSTPPRADRTERASASGPPTQDGADARAPAESGDAPCVPSKLPDGINPTGEAPAASDQPAVEAGAITAALVTAIPVMVGVPAQPVEIAVADKDVVATDTDPTATTAPTATADDARSPDTPDTVATAAVTSVAPTPAGTVAVIAIPVVAAVASDPASADGEVAVAPPVAPAMRADAQPAQVQDPQVAPDAKIAAPADDAAPAKDTATPAKTAVAKEQAQSVLPAATRLSARIDDKTDRPKSEPGRGERAAASARPAPTPAAQSTDTDAPDKQAAPVVHVHAPAADHAAARTTQAEARDIAPANGAPAQPNTILPFINPAVSAFTLPLTAPLTALRVGTAPDVAVPIAGLPIEIAARAEAGLKRFDIRLDPPDLGRIDVRLDVDHDGRVTSRLIVERADTLDLLRRDQPALERALQQAGLKTDGGIDFSLRDQSFREQAPRDNAPTTRLIIPDDEAVASEAVRGYGRLVGLGGGIDIRV